MMAVICILLFLISFLMGKAALKILYSAGKRASLFWEDELLTGVTLLIGLAEAAHLGGLISGRSVSASVKYFLVLTAGALLVSAAILAISLLKNRVNLSAQKFTGTLGKEETALALCLGILIAVQIFRILFRAEVYLDSDLTLETVNGFLYTDRIYESNPITGAAYQAGIPSRLKILCLPTFYAILCRLFSADAELLIWHAVPLLVLLASYAAYGSLAKSLFPENRRHRELFLVLTALLFFAEDSMYGLEGFGLLHGGFQGANIRGAVLIPYLFGLCLRKKWRLLWGPLLAEVCIVWTSYGLGACAAILVLTALINAVFSGRKEGSKCGNS